MCEQTPAFLFLFPFCSFLLKWGWVATRVCKVPFPLRQLGHIRQLHGLSCVSTWCADEHFDSTGAGNREKVEGRGKKPGLLWFLFENIAGPPTVRNLLSFSQKQISLSRAKQIAPVIRSSKPGREKEWLENIRMIASLQWNQCWFCLVISCFYSCFFVILQHYPVSKDFLL